jgi:Patatin-like phospholipase
MEQEKQPLPLNPFQHIALAFSGGGFRAAAFALGTLSYLERIQFNEVKLTENVRFSASTSGGTISNLLYTASRHRGESFASFYAHCLQKLTSDTLLEKVLLVLNADERWDQPGEDKRRNLINAFAKVYDQELFDGEKLGVYWNKKHVPAFEVCFNATEFYRGQGFRFQTDGTQNRHQVIGNNYLYFDVKQLDILKKIKLADVLAASSCFPIGFEPIVFPEDYSYQDNPKELKTTPNAQLKLSTEELRQAMFYENYNEDKLRLSDQPPADIQPDPKQPPFIHAFGLMDGGITDNQALRSLMLADRKRRDRKIPDPFDLVIVTDVTSYFMDGYEVPELKETPSWRRRSIDYFIQKFQGVVKAIKALQIGLLFGFLLLLTTGIIFTGFWVRLPAFLLSGVALTGYVLIAVLKRVPLAREAFRKPDTFDPISVIRDTLPLRKSFSDQIITKLMSYLRLTRLNVLEQMLKARISSVMSMVLDVNLKQARRLIFQMFYDDHCWDNRRVPNFIYELSSHNAVTRSKRIQSERRLKWKATAADKVLLLEGLEKIQPVAEDARRMGTTLWFDRADTDTDRLKNIIATGNFTTCVNLLEYVTSLFRNKVPFDKAVTDQLKDFRDVLAADLEHFKEDPFFLYNELDPGYAKPTNTSSIKSANA